MNELLCLVAVGLIINVVETITLKRRIGKGFEQLKEDMIKSNKGQIKRGIMDLAVTPIVVNLTGRKLDK